MRITRGFDGLDLGARPVVVTVGSFDGLHAGHRVLLARLVEEAEAIGGQSVVVTFDPHPRVALGGEVELLTPLEEKIRLLEELGIDRLIVVPFDRDFAGLTGEEFLRDYLVGRIGAQVLVAGFDHRFGKDGFSPADDGSLRVVRVAAHEIDGEPVSSTRIRRLASQGRTEEVERLLGKNEK